MSVVKFKDISLVEKSVLENPRLSWRAKGLWAHLKLFPTLHTSLSKLATADSIDEIRFALIELVNEDLIDIDFPLFDSKGGKQ